MAFQLISDEERDYGFWAEVSIDVPVKNGFRTSRCKGRFKYLDQSEIDQYIEGSIPDGEEISLLGRVLLEWKDFSDYQGQSIPFDQANRQQAIDTPFVRSGFLRAFFRAVNGNRVKN